MATSLVPLRALALRDRWPPSAAPRPATTSPDGDDAADRRRPGRRRRAGSGRGDGGAATCEERAAASRASAGAPGAGAPRRAAARRSAADGSGARARRATRLRREPRRSARWLPMGSVRDRGIGRRTRRTGSRRASRAARWYSGIACRLYRGRGNRVATNCNGSVTVPPRSCRRSVGAVDRGAPVAGASAWARRGRRGHALARVTRPRGSASWSPSPASTATTAAPRSSPARCATPGTRSSTPACTRRPSRSWRPRSRRTPT